MDCMLCMRYKGMCNALYSLLTYEKTDPNLTNSRKSMLKKDCDTYDSNPKFCIGGFHKLRKQARGRGVSQMLMLLHNLM